MYILPTRYGTILKSSVAFVQVQLSLKRDETVILDVVNVEDVVKLVEEQLDVLHNEEDANVLHSVMKLLDCCITHEPLRAAQKKHLKKLCELISPIVTNVRDKGDDLNPTVFRFYAQQVIKKWGWKVVMIGRQQTLDEFHVTSPQKTEDTSH